jgi:hypothetical protein
MPAVPAFPPHQPVMRIKLRRTPRKGRGKRYTEHLVFEYFTTRARVMELLAQRPTNGKVSS